MQQPPLSQQIRVLEREVGVDLFRRLPRGMELTAAGEVFLLEARTVLEAAERSVTRARAAARGQYGRLVLGITTSATLHPFVSHVLGEYSRTHPGVALDVQEANASDLTEAVANGSTDVAFLRAVVSSPLRLHFMEVLREALVVVLPETHRLRSEELALADLRDERFILVRRPSAPGMYAALLEACRAHGFEPALAAEVGRMLTAISFVAAGVGITLVPESLASIRSHGVRYARLRPVDRLDAPLTVAYRAGELRPALAGLLDVVRQAAAELSETN